MFAIVYRCRREGRPLDRDAIQADPARGELRVQRKGMKRIAVLLGPDGARYMVPVLDKARLLVLNDVGVLLTGYEIVPPRGSKGMGTYYVQTWWCILRGLPPVREPSPAEARARERERQAQEIGRTMAAHDTRRRRG